MCETYGMRWAWLRLTAAYGPMDDRAHLLPWVIQELLAEKRPSVSAGTQEWDYLYVEDVAEAVRSVIVTDAAEGVMNLSATDAWTVRALVERVRDLIDPGLPIGFGERTGTATSVRSDPSRLRGLTGGSRRSRFRKVSGNRGVGTGVRTMSKQVQVSDYVASFLADRGVPAVFVPGRRHGHVVALALLLAGLLRAEARPRGGQTGLGAALAGTPSSRPPH